MDCFAGSGQFTLHGEHRSFLKKTDRKHRRDVPAPVLAALHLLGAGVTQSILKERYNGEVAASARGKRIAPREGEGKRLPITTRPCKQGAIRSITAHPGLSLRIDKTSKMVIRHTGTFAEQIAA